MRDPWERAELAQMFHEHAASSRSRAPLYSALAAKIAVDPELNGLLFHAPPTQRLPVLLFACTHAMLLADSESETPHELMQWYPNLTSTPRSPDDPALIVAFKDFVTARAPELFGLLETRQTQTNEVGRCLLMLPAFGTIAAEVGELAHLDVGCSGGLLLYSDRFQYQYVTDDGSEVATIGPRSPVTLTASVRGTLDLPRQLPTIVSRLGLDIAPIDITDEAEARWLEACVWPDQADRFTRLRSAIGLARADPAELVAGDATTDLAPLIDRLAADAHPVVSNSWVLNYLTGAQRTSYVAELDRVGSAIDLSWVFAEAPALTPELPWSVEPDDPHLTVTTLVRWRNGTRDVTHVATSHPHGYWIHAL